MFQRKVGYLEIIKHKKKAKHFRNKENINPDSYVIGKIFMLAKLRVLLDVPK